MHTYHGSGLENKVSISQFGEIGFGSWTLHPLARELRATRVRGSAAGVAATGRPCNRNNGRAFAYPPHFIFFRYRAICGSAAASPPPDPSMREIARRLRSFHLFHHFESISRYILANLSISTILNSSPRPRHFLPVTWHRYRDTMAPLCWLDRKLGHRLGFCATFER